jgi:1,4-alpha-glucan branching enzyme
MPDAVATAPPGERVAAAAIDAIVAGRHGDPFAVLGMHETPVGVVVRAFVPGAERLSAVTPDGAPLAELVLRHPAGFFEGRMPKRERYRLLGVKI